ncbi:esterase E4-like [Leptopilina heterotoma]|uniref:esterase E4-like n=1 Tax=Leptopilina heterotoma TaxID=63436 RepID=UPI001CA7E580|nr:esterase E4-like [Leptopilina heterotoma]
MWQFTFFALLIIVIGGECVVPEVHTKFGQIQGQYEQIDYNNQNKFITSYLGIPFAEPPVGKLRLKNPVKWTKNYTSILTATKNKPFCVQIDYNGVVTGEEDCLYLNIFVPTTNAKPNTTYPVMVFIRGGSFNMGNTISDDFSPKYLLHNDVILVTFNYRLNFLGFYSTGNETAVGNYGLKDMVTVLKWVQENIKDFYGKPDSVTLFGNSAGAAAIHHLALSKKTKGLFHKIITMSGTALAPWAYHSAENIKNSSLTLANYAGCYNQTFKTLPDNKTIVDESKINHIKIVECMIEKNVTDLLKLTQKFAIWKYSPNCIFGPTSEIDSDDAVVTKSPRKSIKDGDFHDIPWIMGVTHDEGLGMALFSDKDINELTSKFLDIAPQVLEYQEVVKDKKNFSLALDKYYFEKNITEENKKVNLTNMIGDAAIYWPVYETLQKQGNKSNVFFYRFDYEGTYSVMGPKPRPAGVAHMDDVLYLFPFLERNASFINAGVTTTSADDKGMIKLMTEIFSNFAKEGKPISAQSMVEWKPYKDGGKFMRLINGNSTVNSMENDFLVNRMKFWESLSRNLTEVVDEDKSKNSASFTMEKNSVFLCLLIFLGLYYI